jgi:hypothetical protein
MGWSGEGAASPALEGEKGGGIERESSMKRTEWKWFCPLVFVLLAISLVALLLPVLEREESDEKADES